MRRYPRAALNMRGVSLTGFNLGRGLAKRTPAQVRELYADLAGKIRDGVLKAPIDAFFPNRGDQGRLGAGAGGTPQRQGAGAAERPALRQTGASHRCRFAIAAPNFPKPAPR